MNYKIIITPLAKANLLEIKNYIADNLHSPQTAHNFIRKIMKNISLLAETPLIYPLYENDPWRSRGLRHFPVQNYVVSYFADEQAKTVNIINITYGRRDISNRLKDI